MLLAIMLSLVLTMTAACSGFAAITVLPTHVPALAPVTSPLPPVKHYYLALGDSLAFGFQPNLNWVQGYDQQWWYELQRHGSRALVDYGCSDITSDEFVLGGCPNAKVQHNYYSGSQLNAALAFIAQHPGQVGPISLDIGANDVLGDINPRTCAVDPYWRTDLRNLDDNLTNIILPKLLLALSQSTSTPWRELALMNYYNPYQQACPNTDGLVRQFNWHLQLDASMYHVTIVDVYAAFGGVRDQARGVCAYTWMCHWPFSDVHPNSAGYKAIARAFEQATGY